MIKRLSSLLILFFSFHASFAQTNDKRIVALEPQLEKLLTDWKAAGFAVAVVDKDKIIYSKGFGYRDLEKKLPVTPNTLFAIGSCTKAFTSSLIGLLDKDKLVELDKPVHTYLPALSFYNNGMTDNITLRDMMSHRTGLPRHDASWYYFPASSRDTILQRIKFQEPTAGVRDKWQYNNFMFLLQGIVAEKITGQSWEQNIRTKIFSPLGMNRSNFSITDLTKDTDAAIGYEVKKDSLIKKMNYYEIGSMGPAGSINSSVTEMSNWVRTWINGGKFNAKEILPEAYTRQAISSQMVISAALPEKENPDLYLANYGLGWGLSSYRGHYWVEHGGNIDGFSASTSFFPTDSIGIIVLTNQNGSGIPSLVRNMIADKLLNLPYRDWNGNRKKAVEKAKVAEVEAKKSFTGNRKAGTTPSHPLKDYTGVYNHPGYGTIEVFTEHDSLFFQTPNKKFWLKHYHYDVFDPYEIDAVTGIDTTDFDGSSPTFFQFNMNTKGEINSVSANLEPAVKPLEFLKKEKEVALTAEALQRYTGDYELSGTPIKIYTKGNTLYAFIPGQPDYELTSVGGDKFVIKTLSGFALQFHSDDKQTVSAVSFIQPNGTFKATRKK
jgi:CubicO group peptidase (beta-lactamase class C family)